MLVVIYLCLLVPHEEVAWLPTRIHTSRVGGGGAVRGWSRCSDTVMHQGAASPSQHDGLPHSKQSVGEVSTTVEAYLDHQLTLLYPLGTGARGIGPQQRDERNAEQLWVVVVFPHACRSSFMPTTTSCHVRYNDHWSLSVPLLLARLASPWFSILRVS